MITEDYCSFEISKLLKEKGFDGECIGCYWDSKKTFDINYEPLSYSDGDLRDEVIIAPTHQMAMKWLREMHRKYIDIRYNNQNEEYRFIVFTMVKDKPIDFIHSEYHSTYEEAVEAALKYVLEKFEKFDITQENKDRLTELGWHDIEKKMPPLGERINVMRVISRDHQQLWQQSFNSVAEVFASGVTHWAKIKI